MTALALADGLPAPAPLRARPGLRLVFVRALQASVPGGALRMDAEVLVHEDHGTMHDDITDVLNYERLVRALRRLAEAHGLPVTLLAERGCAECLAEPGVTEARVHIARSGETSAEACVRRRNAVAEETDRLRA